MECGNNCALNTLIFNAQNGSQVAFESLLAQYTPLIEAMTQEFYSALLASESREDCYQEACIAFYRAVEHFDATRSVEFGAYAKACIRNQLLSFCRKVQKQQPVVSLDNQRELAEMADVVDAVVSEESYNALYQKIESVLSGYESRIWWLYLSGRTAKEIAAQLDIGEKSVQNAVYRIRKKLRAAIPNP